MKNKIKSILALTLIICGNISLFATGTNFAPDTPCANGADPNRDCPCPTCGCPSEGSPNFIDIYTGNEKRQIDDLQIWGGVGEHQLTWSRYGASRFTNGTKTFGNGFGWRHSYQWDFTATASDTSGPKAIDIYYPNGVHNTFNRTTTPGSTFKSVASVRDILTLNSTQNVFTLQRPDGFQYVFNLVTIAGVHKWRLAYFLDTQQNAYTFTYNSSNQLIKVTEPGGRYFSITYAVLTYNNSNQTSVATVSAPTAGWNTIVSSSTNAYRYWRYQGADNTYSPVAEVQFLDATGTPLTGTPFGSGTPPVSGQDYTKAFDGDTTSIFTSSIPAGDYVGLDLGTKQSVASVKFFTPAGDTIAMKNGHFYGSNVQPQSITVISRVDTSDGRSVTYDYTQFNDPSLPFSWQCLTAAHYGDGTSASYTYQQEYPGTLPLVVQAIDPRVHGQGTNLKWVYDVTDTNLVGFVHQEQDGVTGQAIVTFTSSQNGNTITPVANFANGGSLKCNVYEPTTLASSKVDSLGRTTSYTYDQAGAGFLTSMKDALNRTTSWTYTAYENPLTQTNPDGSVKSWTRDLLDLVLTYTDELGRVTTYTRDAYHRVTQITYPDSSFETFSYNGFGEVTSHQLRNGGTEGNAYNSSGLRTSHTDPLGNVTSYTYDAFSRLASVTDAKGNTTAFQYDERGNVLQKTQADGSCLLYTYDAFGDQLSVTNELGNTWGTSYDEWKRKTSVTDPLGRTISYSYALPGGGCGCAHFEDKPTLITLASGKAIAVTYDTEWQKTSVTEGIGTADAATTSFGYDAVGNNISIADPKGDVWHKTYDNRNRLIASSDPLNHAIQYTYDYAGNVLTTTRPDGGVTANTYDAMNRLVVKKDPLSQSTSFTYDNSGNMASFTDANNNIYSYTYDLRDMKLSMIYPDGSQELYSYDSVGNQTTYTNRTGQTDTYTYDNRDRNTQEVWSAGAPTVTRTFDAAGRLLTLGNTVSALTYAYNAADQLLSETQDLTALDSGLSIKTVAYTYDADGNRATLTYPAGDIVSYSYTNRNQVSSISLNGPPPMATFAYDLNGNRLSKSLENSTTASYIYDAANRLTNLSHVVSGGAAAFASFGYTYNSVNDRTNRVEGSGTNAAVTDNYTYNGVDEVTAAVYGSGRNVNYVYDPVGNRSSVVDSGATISYTTNNLNQYNVIGSLTPGYDSNGSLTNYNGWTYAYDALNRLTSAGNGTTTVTFAYDARNRCVNRTVNGTEYYFTYDEWNLIEDRNVSDSQEAYYVNGSDVDEKLAMISTSGPNFYHEDGLGSVVRITSNTGQVMESYTYDIYGSVSMTDGSGNPLTSSVIGNRFLFTGREWLRSVMLYDYRNRLYSANLGRFLQTDPVRFNSGDANLYRYVYNDPTSYVDSDGLACSNPNAIQRTVSNPAITHLEDINGGKLANLASDVYHKTHPGSTYPQLEFGNVCPPDHPIITNVTPSLAGMTTVHIDQARNIVFVDIHSSGPNGRAANAGNAAGFIAKLKASTITVCCCPKGP